MTYEQEKARLEFERRVTLRVAQHELQQLQMEKHRAELLERDTFKSELRYRMRQNTTKYVIPKRKIKIAVRRETIKQQRLQQQNDALELHVFTQRQIEVAQRIIDRMEGRNND